MKVLVAVFIVLSLACSQGLSEDEVVRLLNEQATAIAQSASDSAPTPTIETPEAVTKYPGVIPELALTPATVLPFSPTPIPMPTSTPRLTPILSPTNTTSPAPTPGPTLTSTPTPTPNAAQRDRETLIAIYNATGGHWEHDSDWLSSAPISTWFGVTVNDSGRVVKLDLSSRNMISEIPPQFGDLDELQYLELDFSDLFGEIPPELGNLRNLKYLSLQGNDLSGSIPPELGNLTNLTHLNLKFNRNLTGEIPVELGNLPNLNVLYLDAVGHTNLSGCLPSNWRNLPVNDLDELGLPFCVNSVSVPTTPTITLPSVTPTASPVSTPTPASTATMTPIPTTTSQFTPTFTSTRSATPAPLPSQSSPTSAPMPTITSPSPTPIPKESKADREALIAIYHATGGDNWRFDFNWLSYAWIGTWSGVTVDGDGRVVSLDLAIRGMTGRIPSELSSLDKLEYLALWSNELIGEIPASLGELKNLKHLSLKDNNLSGEIPAELGNLTNLTYLDLSWNKLTGEVPARLGNLPKLDYLYLEQPSYKGDGFVGCVPTSLKDVIENDLDELELPFCTDSDSTDIAPTFTPTSRPAPIPVPTVTILSTPTPTPAPIPTPMLVPTDTAVPTPRNIPLQTPALPGSAQSDREALIAIYHATGGDWSFALNWLSDAPIGTWFGVEVGRNGRVISLDLTVRSITGEIPSELTELSGLEHLDLTFNHLTGEIPAWIGELKNLKHLSIKGNDLSGEIPAEIGKLTNLTYLDLSFNSNLNGEIPAELGNLPKLDHLYLDAIGYTKFSGCIPNSLKRISENDLDRLELPFCN